MCLWHSVPVSLLSSCFTFLLSALNKLPDIVKYPLILGVLLFKMNLHDRLLFLCGHVCTPLPQLNHVEISRKL